MADKTITQLTATTLAATADEIPIWVAGSAVTRKITKANFLQGAFTGGGTVATGGFTLTVPATGTAALYTSGTWTPTLEGTSSNPTVTYAEQLGYYTKIADICIAVVRISTSAFSGGSGQLRLAGLPFTCANNYGTGSCLGKFTFPGSATQAVLLSIVSTTKFYIVGNTSGADTATVGVTGWAATSYMTGTLIYKTA